MTLSHRKTRSTHTSPRRVRQALSIAAVILGVFACSSTAALAATPEEPKTEPVTVFGSTTATFAGVLAPNADAAGELEYEFFYAARSPACTEFAVSFPEGPRKSPAKKGEAVQFAISGLEANTEYAVCIAVRGAEEEPFVFGQPVTFKTLAAAPAVISENAAPKATEARLEAVVNPNNEPTECHIQYGEALVGENTVPCGESVTLDGGRQTIGVTVSGLMQQTHYRFRVLLKNAMGPAEGEEHEFETTLPPETPEALAPKPLGARTATLRGVLNPAAEGEPGTYQFLYKKSPAECEGTGGTVTEPVSSLGASSEAVSGEVSGLLPSTTYTFCVRAANTAGETATSAPVTFKTTATAATVGEETFTEVGSASATLHAPVDPGGSPTSYFFEYGTSTSYGTSTPTVPAGAGSVPVSVLATIGGLQPETTYHFRAVARNGEGSNPGADATFNTYPEETHGLPDHRGYEAVSPLDNPDTGVFPGRPERAAANGSAVTYVGGASNTGGNGQPVILTSQIRPSGTNAWLAQRSSTGGWASTNLQPTGLTETGYEGFSDDLSAAAIISEHPIVEGAPPGQHLYSRDANGAYQLLAANAAYEGATPDGTHILVRSEGALFDATNGQLAPVNVLNGGGSASNAVFGSPVASGVESFATTTGDLERVISDDGSRIFWSTLNAERQPEALYVREDAASASPATLQLDAAEAGCESCVSGGGLYWTASSDGSRVFFTDERQLTSDSTATIGKPDLYEYQVNNETGKPGKLTDLTPNTKEEPTNVVGVLGASTDGSYVYFAAAGGIANTGASPQKCLPESNTRCNVYVVHEGEAPKLVATVAEIDGVGNVSSAVVIPPGESASYFGDWVRNVGVRSAHVTSDGRHLVFESIEDLAGFDSERGREIFAYDFGSGVVSCVSCNPTGAPTIHAKVGVSYHADAELPESFSSTFVLRDMSVNGDRVFFISNERLVGQDTNAGVPLPDFNELTGLANVFEWEREGAESCPVKTPARLNGGCIFLLSQAASTESAYFVDASESGDDVFFESRAQLVPQDHGEQMQLYDARVGASESPAESQCTGAGCQGVPAAPPSFATPSSVTITGVDDLEPPLALKKKTTKKMVRCAKGKKLSHKKCVTVRHKKRKSKPKKSAKGSKKND
jgi:hypothetical protein